MRAVRIIVKRIDGQSFAPYGDGMTHAEIMQVALEARCHSRTVERLIKGEPVRAVTKHAIREAARKLGLEMPREVRA